MGNIFSMSSLIYTIIFMHFYFSKERVKTIETKTYSYLLITTFIGLLIDTAAYIMHESGFNVIGISFQIVTKLVLIYYLAWVFEFFFYIYAICGDYRNTKSEVDKKNHKMLNILLIIYFLIILFIAIFPISFLNEKGLYYPTGISVNLTYFLCFLMIFVTVIYALINKKNIEAKKATPLYLLVSLTILIFIIKMIFVNVFLLNYALSIVIVVFYFTLENPDVKMLRQLELAKESADRANRAKSEFLSSMSHEIRTPLNAIVGFSGEIVKDESLDQAKLDAKDIIMASENLLEIVNGVLDISKIEAGKMEIVENDYKPVEAFEDLVKLVGTRIGEKPVELKTSYADDIPAILNGDSGKVKEVITNLLTNSVKYTDKGQIILNVRCVNNIDKTTLVISVEDTGRGIKKDKIDKLFTKFERMEEDRNTTIEGTGLGLAITKQLVEMMGGKIVVQSIYGKGSIFTMYIPQKIVSMVEIKEPVAMVSTKKDFTGKKVLVVDDNELNIKIANRILVQYNIIVDSCISGYECLEKLKTNNYDLILLDDMMPNFSGRETLIQIKENKIYTNPVVVLTANATAGEKEKYLTLGFDNYLAKPIDKEELNQILNMYL